MFVITALIISIAVGIKHIKTGDVIYTLNRYVAILGIFLATYFILTHSVTMLSNDNKNESILNRRN
jgi:Ca2+/Na+ antiporter